MKREESRVRAWYWTKKGYPPSCCKSLVGPGPYRMLDVLAAEALVEHRAGRTKLCAFESGAYDRLQRIKSLSQAYLKQEGLA